MRSPRADSGRTTPGPAGRRISIHSWNHVRFCLSLSPRSPRLRRLEGCRRRTTPGWGGLFAGDEHPPGIPTPSLPFLLCEPEHPNPKLKAFGHLTPPSLENLLQNYPVYTSMYLCWVRPCSQHGEREGYNVALCRLHVLKCYLSTFLNWLFKTSNVEKPPLLFHSLGVCVCVCPITHTWLHETPKCKFVQLYFAITMDIALVKCL